MTTTKKIKQSLVGIELVRLLAYEGERIFTTDRARELAPRVGLKDPYLWEALYHLRQNGWIVSLRRGLYALSATVPGLASVHEFEGPGKSAGEDRRMKRPNIPQTDSIQELAHFWDTHDLTDFENELEEVGESVFERPIVIPVRLEPEASELVKELAQSRGISDVKLIQEWIAERIEASSRSVP